MKLPKDFGYYLQTGIIRKKNPDFQKAEFLLKSAESSFRGLVKRLNQMGIEDDTANSIIKDCYDILMELIRARLLVEGYSSSGNFSHEAEISYLKKLGFEENKIRFMNELRFNRNSVIYYGKILSVEYAKKVIDFMKSNYVLLKKVIGDKKI